MKIFQKILLLLFVFPIFLLGLSFLEETSAESFREVQEIKGVLSESYHEAVGGIGSFVKGLWGIFSNTGKLLWHGTQKGVTKAKQADRWTREKLW